MRLGAFDCLVRPGTAAFAAFGRERITERLRHRYEVNNDYRGQLEAAGLLFSGTSPDRSLVEIVELPSHPWFVGIQSHPEFLSKPTEPHPLFRDFIGASLRHRRESSRARLVNAG